MLMPLKKPMNQPPKPFQLRPQLRKLVRKLQLKKLQQLKNQPRKDQLLKKPCEGLKGSAAEEAPAEE
jgi:hypothetical protein